MSDLTIFGKKIGLYQPTYFIADIAANHDGDLERAKSLIYLCAKAGADAAKFQHFSAKTIVSDYGFRSLGSQKSHQAKWDKSVFEIYEDASLNPGWTPILQEVCRDAGIAFLTSPYSFELVDLVEPYVEAFKVGSGDITWLDLIKYMAQKGKPIFLATGAATCDEVCQAVNAILSETKDIAIMQCNTNYTGSPENFKYINLNVLRLYKEMYPEAILGLSDHTPGHATVLGAVALGARVIEKHFTDDISRKGPDHSFSMDFKSWNEMVSRTRELEISLGSSVKRVEPNEAETVVLQRRSIRAKSEISPGTVITQEMLDFLRPCPIDALPPYKSAGILGKTTINKIREGECLKWIDLA